MDRQKGRGALYLTCLAERVDIARWLIDEQDVDPVRRASLP